MEAAAYFRGKKITVMGLGLLGGVGEIKFLAENGADIIATDLKCEAELKSSLDILRVYPNIRFTLERHDLADFQNRDLIIKAPGCPLGSPYIAEAGRNGIEVTMWSALFARFAREAGATIVGITGTRGKTTVTEMLAAILRAAGKSVIEGGNVQGTSLLPQLARTTNNTVAVLELDSWKLQGFGEAKISPNIGVFTTFFPDHLNYYKGSMDAYLADKANIFLNQTENDVLILGAQAEPIVREGYKNQIKSKIVVANMQDMPEGWVLCIPGQHNRYNAALALLAARELGVPDETSRLAIESFKGVPGRLEFLREIRGVKVYNDTTSTTPESTMVALTALGPARTVLMAGGTDKQLPVEGLIEKLREAKTVVLLAGSGTERIRGELPAASVYNALQPAVAKAFELAEPGDNLLFSPGFTSFEMFKNEYDRGAQFLALIEKI